MTTFKIEGMKCAGCVKTVTEAVEQLPAVQSVKANLETGTIAVDGDVSAKQIAEALEGTHYQVKTS